MVLLKTIKSLLMKVLSLVRRTYYKIDRHKRIAYVDVELLGKLTRVQVGLEIISKS